MMIDAQLGVDATAALITRAVTGAEAGPIQWERRSGSWVVARMAYSWRAV
jgi:hypothetical protein